MRMTLLACGRTDEMLKNDDEVDLMGLKVLGACSIRTRGYIVTVASDLADDATAASVGFQKGDIILAVNNQKIAKTSDLEKATRESARLWRIIVVRGGQQINVTLGG